MTTSSDYFPTDTSGLKEARPAEAVELADGDGFDFRIAPVAKRLGDTTLRMLAYNGSIPGPTLRVAAGSELVVGVVNEGDLEATVHWHGLRLENRYDGAHQTQQPIPSAAASRTGSPSRIPASTGTTLTSARTTARSSGCTGTSSCSRRNPITSRRSTASSR